MCKYISTHCFFIIYCLRMCTGLCACVCLRACASARLCLCVCLCVSMRVVLRVCLHLIANTKYIYIWQCPYSYIQFPCGPIHHRAQY